MPQASNTITVVLDASNNYQASIRVFAAQLNEAKGTHFAHITHTILNSDLAGFLNVTTDDVASGLKWALLSQSVVLMPVPKHTSWAMEELLEPWVHYVPLNADASDVEEKMRWVVEHDDHARRIAQRGSLWMQDLVFHPESLEDDREIQEEILRRYMAHFSPVSDGESRGAATQFLRSS